VRSGPSTDADQVEVLSEGAVVDGTRVVTDGFRELEGDRWAADQFLIDKQRGNGRCPEHELTAADGGRLDEPGAAGGGVGAPNPRLTAPSWCHARERPVRAARVPPRPIATSTSVCSGRLCPPARARFGAAPLPSTACWCLPPTGADEAVDHRPLRRCAAGAARPRLRPPPPAKGGPRAGGRSPL
jgi:hypothetical protein